MFLSSCCFADDARTGEQRGGRRGSLRAYERTVSARRRAESGRRGACGAVLAGRVTHLPLCFAKTVSSAGRSRMSTS